MDELTNFLKTESVSMELFAGSAADEIDRTMPDIVQDMQEDFFVALNKRTFRPRTEGCPTVTITPREPITVEEARQRIQALADKRGIELASNTVYTSGHAFYMEAKK